MSLPALPPRLIKLQVGVAVIAVGVTVWATVKIPPLLKEHSRLTEEIDKSKKQIDADKQAIAKLTENIDNLGRDRTRSENLAKANHDLRNIAERSRLTEADRSAIVRAGHAVYCIGVFGYRVPQKEIDSIVALLSNDGYSINYPWLLTQKPPWYANMPSVLYYSDDTKGVAKEIADRLSGFTPRKFVTLRGGGAFVPRDEDQRKWLLYVHDLAP